MVLSILRRMYSALGGLLAKAHTEMSQAIHKKVPALLSLFSRKGTRCTLHFWTAVVNIADQQAMVVNVMLAQLHDRRERRQSNAT